MQYSLIRSGMSVGRHMWGGQPGGEIVTVPAVPIAELDNGVGDQSDIPSMYVGPTA